jgi:hypothetical protein
MMKMINVAKRIIAFFPNRCRHVVLQLVSEVAQVHLSECALCFAGYEY